MPKTTNEIQTLLELGRWDDLETDISGWEAIRRVDIAPMAYEIKINAPLEGRRLQLVVDFAKPVKSEYISRLYSLCNGLRIGSLKFAIYGLLNTYEDPEEIPLGCSTFDISDANTYEFPEGIDNDVFIIGVGTEGGKGTDELNSIHYMEIDGKVRVVDKLNVKQVLRSYEDVEVWLKNEFERALADQTRF